MTTNLTAVASKVEKRRGTSLPSATDNGGSRERSRSERRTLLRVLREVSCVNSIFGRRLSTDCASRSCNGDPCSRFQAPRAIHPRPWQRHEQREEQPVRQTCERWEWHLFWAQATAIGERRHLMAIWRAFVAFTASFLPPWKTPATLMREGLFASIHKTNHRVRTSGCAPPADFEDLQENPNKRRAYTHASKDPPHGDATTRELGHKMTPKSASSLCCFEACRTAPRHTRQLGSFIQWLQSASR